MEYSSTSGIRSPFSPRLRQPQGGRGSFGMSSIKKTRRLIQDGGQTGDVVYKTQHHAVETFGSPLPVMVTEALTFSSGEVSVRLSGCGWCWLVAGRRVLAWPHRETRDAPGQPLPPPAARELTLPQTDLAHKADLVMLYYGEGGEGCGRMPSCVGVSPEGAVRYWPSVAQQSVYVDESAELAGQECDRLTEPGAEGLVLATTTCTVVVLAPHSRDGRPGVLCRTLRPPSGWLGGLGRRVSLLFFGTMPAQVMDTRLVGVVVLETAEADWCVALVASGPVLQLWRRGPELHEHDLRRPLREALCPMAQSSQQHADAPAPGPDLVALAVRARGDTLLMLLASPPDAARPNDTRYFIAHVCVSDPGAPRVSSVVGVERGGGAAGADGEPLCFVPLGARTLLYTASHLAIVSSTNANEKSEVVDVGAEGDRVLAAELCAGLPLLFTRNHGLVLLRATDGACTDLSTQDSGPGTPHTQDLYDGNLSLYEIDPREVSMVSTDACGKLKTAFLYHLRRDALASRGLVHELFPPPSPPASPQRRPPDADVDAALDRTVLTIALQMLDDVPAGDPRWRRGEDEAAAGAGGIPLGSSCALQIAAQLRDKQRAFALFVDFLRATGLWQRLQSVTCEKGCGSVGTRAQLAELPERLAAAAALQRLHHGPDNHLIDAALHHVVCSDEDSAMEELVKGGVLSAADACYRRVSRIGRVLLALSRLARTEAPPAAAAALTPAAATQLHRTAHVLLAVLGEVRKCRSQWASALGYGAAQPDAERAHAWTSHLAGDSLLLELAQLQLALTRSARECADATQRAQLYEQAVSLARPVLDEASHLTRSPRTAPHYEAMRRQAILPFVDDGQYERAAVLAEKFRDFELLVEMCFRADDFDRLYSYVDKYADEGFAETAFAWLAERGGASAARLVRLVGARYPARLAAWLARAPARGPLLALQHLSARRYGAAARALHDLACDESHNLHRMTTMASLAKLCLVAADEEEDGSESSEGRARLRRGVEGRLTLAEHHAALPRDVRLHHGLSPDDRALHSPADLVEMYVTTESRSLTEYDYKKALDLLELVRDPHRRHALRLQVWCATLHAHEWHACRTDAPQDVLQQTTFFRLVDLVHLMGERVEECLPLADEVLTAAEARAPALATDERFHYLLRYGYESLQRAHHPPTPTATTTTTTTATVLAQ